MSDRNGATAELRPVRTETELRELLGDAIPIAQAKQIDHIDKHARTIIQNSPLALMATSDDDGRCDVTPRGDPAGSVLVLDGNTLVVAERPGNRRYDSLRNIVRNPWVGMMFLVPGMNETLRVNGRATIVSDGPFFDDMQVRDKRPIAAVVVEVHEVFMHCAKAFLRSSLWRPETWPDRTELPTGGEILRDHTAVPMTAEQVDGALAEDIRLRFY